MSRLFASFLGGTPNLLGLLRRLQSYRPRLEPRFFVPPRRARLRVVRDWFRRKPSVNPPPGGGEGAKVERLLLAAQDERCHVVVVALDATRSVHGQIIATTEEAVIVGLLPDDRNDIFWPGTLCCVSYYFKQSAHTFLTRVFRHDLGEVTGQKRLLLQRPKQVTELSGRMAIRVPVPQGVNLRVRVTDGEHTIQPKVGDISVTGLFARLENLADDPRWRPDDEVQVSLQFEDIQTGNVPAVIRRAESGAYGIGFQYAVSMGNLVAPRNLREVIRRIERAALEHTFG